VAADEVIMLLTMLVRAAAAVLRQHRGPSKDSISIYLEGVGESKGVCLLYHIEQKLEVNDLATHR
jgi:hypothetical protein